MTAPQSRPTITQKTFYLHSTILIMANDFGQIAQSVEQRTENPRVGSSILSLATSFLIQINMNLLWVGLGNPGKNYQHTRHNIGADVLLSLFPDVQWRLHKKWNAFTAQSHWQEFSLTLLLPQTFMNLSGEAVVPALKQSESKCSELLVFHDEIELPPSAVKYKFAGGHKGHNGLRNVMALCKDNNFHRLRLGVGRPSDARFSVADYVLSRYSNSEFPSSEEVWNTLEKEYLPKIKTGNSILKK